MKPNGTERQQFYFQARRIDLISSWCSSPWKRRCDIAAAALLLILLLPLMIVVALAVKLTSSGPILFRQRRPGKDGREFCILKFRTMLDRRRHAGPEVTRAEDPRVTFVGRYLRRWKLDELPQLLNVLCGHMSFVGPRPLATWVWREPSIQTEAEWVHSVRPGITSQATLTFRNEEEILAPLSTEDLEEVYMSVIMPLKLRMDLEYLRNAGFASDLRLLCKTVLRVFNPREEANDRLIKEHLSATIQNAYRPVLVQKEEYVPVTEQAD